MENNVYVPSEEQSIQVEELSKQMTYIETKEPEPLVLGHTTNTAQLVSAAACWPYYQYPYQYVKTSWVSIDRAENGFVVIKDGKTYVCKTVSEVSKLLEKE